MFQSPLRLQHLKCERKQTHNTLILTPLFQTEVIQQSLPISYETWETSNVPVVANRLYQLKIATVFRVANNNSSQQQYQVPQFQFIIGFHPHGIRQNHVINTLLNPRISCLNTTIFVPEHIDSINVLCKISNPSLVFFEHVVFEGESSLSMVSNKEMETTQIHAHNEYRLNSNSEWFLQFSHHLYLLHVPSVPLGYSYQLREQLELSSNFSYLFSKNTKTDATVFHNPRECSACFFKSKESVAAVKQTISSSYELDELDMKHLWIEALEHALIHHHYHVTILRDDIRLIQDWKSQITQHISCLNTRTMPIVLFGAFHKMNSKITSETDSYSVKGDANDHSVFAVLIKSRDLIKSTLDFLKQYTSGAGWYSSIIKFWLQQKKTSSITILKPNIMYPYFKYSSHAYKYQKHNSLFNTVPSHPLYWDQQEEKGEKQQRQLTMSMNTIHIFMPLFVGCPKLEKIVDALQNQTYPHWKLYVIGQHNNNHVQDVRVKKISTTTVWESMLEQIQTLSNRDWITFQSPYNISVATRLEDQMRSSLRFHEQHNVIIGCVATTSRICNVNNLTIDKFTLFSTVQILLPRLLTTTKITSHETLSFHLEEIENSSNDLYCMNEIITCS